MNTVAGASRRWPTAIRLPLAWYQCPAWQEDLRTSAAVNRIYVQLPAPRTLPGFERWKGLKTIGIAILTCLRNGKETTEMRYYISGLGLGVNQFARAVRSHRSIENSLHWSLDVTDREDQSRIRHEHLRENVAWLNRFTLSLLKQHPAKMSQAMKRRSCGWSDGFLLQVVTGQGG